MKLSKSDSLFLYGLLFHLVAKNETGLAPHVEDQISDFLDDLTQSLLDEDSSSSDEASADDQEEDSIEVHIHERDHDDDEEESEDDDDADDEEEESIEADEVVDPLDVEELPSLRVSQDNKKSSLEFNAASEPDRVEVVVDGQLEYEAIALQIKDNILILHTDDGEHEYRFDKLPKKWSKVFSDELVYAFQREDQ